MKKLTLLLPRYTTLFLISVLFTIISVLLITVPYMISPGTIVDLSGSVGIIDNGDQFKDLPIIPRITYLIGDVECHQKASRSYFLNGNQMPICARDIGIFIGVPLLLFPLSYRRFFLHPFYFILGLAPLGIDGSLQLFTAYESTNIVRLITGLIAGIAIALAISWIRHEVIEIRDMKTTIMTAPAENDKLKENSKISKK